MTTKTNILISALILAVVLISGCVGSETEPTSDTPQTTASENVFTQIDKLELQISEKTEEIDAIYEKIDRRGSSLLSVDTATIDELLKLNSDLQTKLSEFDNFIGKEQEIISGMQQSNSSLSEKELAKVNAWKEVNIHFLEWSRYEKMAGQNWEKALSFVKFYIVAADDLENADKKFDDALTSFEAKNDPAGAINKITAAQTLLRSSKGNFQSADRVIGFEATKRFVKSIDLLDRAYGKYKEYLQFRTRPTSGDILDASAKYAQEAYNVLPTSKEVNDEIGFWKRVNIYSVQDKAADELSQAKKTIKQANEDN